MKKLFFVLLFLAYSFACNSSVTIPALAVVGEDAQLVNLTVAAFPGNGRIYFSIPPIVGTDTQASMEDAVHYAFSLANKVCDVVVSFDDVSYIEGPSAGATLTLLTYAALTDSEIRSDAVMTGTIEGSTIGVVGGIYEKARVAAEEGYSYVIVPYTSIYEKFLLDTLEEKYGIEVIETTSFEDALNFMINYEPIEEPEIPITPRTLPENLIAYDDNLSFFEPVVREIILLEQDSIDEIPIRDDSFMFVETLKSELNNQELLLDKGYLYTAANFAFLAYIDSRTVSSLLADDVDLKDARQRVEQCLDSLPEVPTSRSNFEWIVGAQVREQWARNNLNFDSDGLLQIEKFAVLNDIYYAEAWCAVAKSLYNNAPESSNAFNQSVWEAIAAGKIKEAEQYNPQGEYLERLLVAKKSYEEGKYGAAVFDAAYVVAGMKDLIGENYTLTSFKTMWARVYASHAAFLEQAGNPAAARNTYLFAQELELSITEMELRIPEESVVSDKYYLFVLFALFLVIVSIVYLVHFRLNSDLSKKTYGKKKYKR